MRPLSSPAPPHHRRLLLLLLRRPFSGLSRGPHNVSRHCDEDEESRKVKVSVWWDFENCHVPMGTNTFTVVSTITAAVRANGIRGPIEITAFGDMMQLTRARQEGLSATGINLTHIPSGGKNSADRSFLLNLMFWVSQNPPPAHLLLISGDRDFASTLHRLRMSNYNILLATPERTSGVLCSAASIVWNWQDLLRGDNLTGKYFNQPPDSSWYGHYEVPLENPFSYVDQQGWLQSQETSAPKSCAKPGSVPKAVMRKISEILQANPKGIAINELCSELSKTLNLDREYYGYKRFLPFLLSLENNILKIKKVSADSNYIIHGVSQYYCDDYERDSSMVKELSDNSEVDDVNLASEFNCENKSVPESEDRTSRPKLVKKLSSSSPSDLNGNDRLVKTQKNSALDKNMSKMANSPDYHSPCRDEKIFEMVIVDEKIAKTVSAPDNQFPLGDGNIVETVSAQESDSPIPVVVQQDSLPKDGFFRKFWRKLSGSKSSGSDNMSSEDEEKCMKKDLEMDLKSGVGNVDVVFSSSESSSLSESAQENRPSTSSAASVDKPVFPGFIDRIRNMCRFSNAFSASNKAMDISSDQENPIIKEAGHELFLNDSFWSSIESFLKTSEGSVLVTESTTREVMARDFQSKGPACLQSLGENDLLRFVDILISEKKWVEESSSEVFPFKLSQVEKRVCSEYHRGSNALSSIFLSSMSQPADHNIEGKSEQVSNDIEEQIPVRSRDEVLADCQNLLNKILKEHPEGFFVGLFRKHFLERYGYHLDLHKLGFPKLVALLRNLSGLKIEAGYIIPCDSNPSNTTRVKDSFHHEQENVTDTAASDIQSSDVPKNDNGLDSLWDELGPVASKSSVAEETDCEFEPAMSDDEFSDSVETSPTERGDEHSKAQMEENGSLLQILDTWHTRNGAENKGAENCQSSLSNTDLVPSTAKLSSSGLSLAETMRGMNSTMHGKKQRSQKTYQFVADPCSDDDSDKLVHGIIGNLRKSPNVSPKKAKSKVLYE